MSSEKEIGEKVIIGLEIHAYLNTDSKLFCSCSTDSNGAEPNSKVCPICLGHPGCKPVLNAKAVELATKIGLALNCQINKDFFFSRKTYFYPDMAMNYQITQYEVPVAQKGYVNLSNGKKIGITRAHIEWDPAALIHPNGMGKSNYVQIDYNRSGLPLIEIVTEPDISTPKEAREFLNSLENILKYLNVLKPDSTLKVDSNISIYPNDRVEIKNISGYAAVEKALNFELLRQRRELRMNKPIEQHTRAYNADNGTTVELRKKESESDYGYIFDPDLVKVSLTEEQVEQVRKDMPELPEAKAIRFQNDYGLNEYDARVITSDKYLGDLFAKLAQKSDTKIAARLLTRELLAILNHDSLSLNDVQVSVEALVELISLIKEGKVSDKNTKQSMINYISGDKTKPKEYLEKNNLLILEKINIDEIVSKVLLENNSAAEDYNKGNQKSFNFLVGLVMRETKGTVSPQEVQDIVRKKLGE
jgi:aspartyl-tRNA(Asn)/glutamyl-tRNA(Gln) amidotransferase subunit B